jgi:hypothetical protein
VPVIWAPRQIGWCAPRITARCRRAADILAKKPLPQQPPRLNKVLRLTARLGGFLGRKGDGEPGVKTIWLGLQPVMDFAAGLKFARDVHEF